MNELVVVTGLPRSGTSLLMSMLQAGGLELVSDGGRPADQHNPRGYFEAGTWSEADSGGKAVKLLDRQLEKADLQGPVRVLLLERDLTEVAASQQKMLGQPPDGRDWPELLSRELHRFKGWLAGRGWPVWRVEHRRLIHQPQEVARELQTFLGRPLDLKAMAGQVDPALYRNRQC
ncbi:MAG: sulfotransferase family protein [Candidatus Eremiobacteraeota bacterium]|nr:sulfotransferase family protein [Candidatus Eremiobacteraeota bacterium]MCW5868314.1 sulfotransferase family protein [Candidatus Eremiobacteraeota bacterium]